jgi:O-antigen/teichoic acid export membrane protein
MKAIIRKEYRIALTDIMSRIMGTGIFDLIFSNIIVQLSALITIFALADILAPSEVGFFRLLFGYFVLFQTLGLLGCNASILKFCSEDINIDIKLARLRYFRRRSFLASLFAVLVFNVFLFLFVEPISRAASLYMHIYTLAVPFAVYSLCSLAYLQALKKVKVAARTQGLIRLSFAIIAIIGGLWGGLAYVIYLTSLGYIVASLALYLLLRESKYNGSTSLIKIGSAEKLSAHSLGMLAAGAITILQQNIDLYLLGFFSAQYQIVADFALASMIFTAGVLVTGTIQTVLTPYLSEKQDNLLWVRQKTIKLQILLIPCSFILGLFLYFGLSILIRLGLFAEYPNALTFAVPMIIKYWIWSLFCVLGAALFAIGVVRETLIYGFLLVLLNVFVSMLAVHLYGVEYIIYSQPIVVCAQFLAVLHIFNQKTKKMAL